MCRLCQEEVKAEFIETNPGLEAKIDQYKASHNTDKLPILRLPDVELLKEVMACRGGASWVLRQL